MDIDLRCDLDIINLVKNISFIESELSIDDTNSLNINLCSGSFINVSVVAILANWINYIKKKGYKLDVSINIDNKCEFKNYIARMNFFNIIDFPYKEEFTRHDEDGKFLPINMIERYDSKLIDKLTLIFKKVLLFDKDNPTLYMLDYSLNEIIENIDRHSETLSDSTIVSQYYRSRNRLEVTILDNGIGIPNALRKTLKYKNWTDEQCLSNSIKKEIRTENTENEGQGNGLYILKRFINLAEGELKIYSGNSVYEYDATRNKEKTYKINGFWKGTIINFVINTNKDISISEVMEDDNYECFSPALDELFD
jgi:histidine kinase-, DNA gyrase B-, and HSP90-like ATPase